MALWLHLWSLWFVNTAFAQDSLPETQAPANPAPFEIPDFAPVSEPPVPIEPLPAPVGQAPPYRPPVPVITQTRNDKVFLAPIQSYAPALNNEAARLSAVLQTHMATRYQLVTIDQVPPWPDYSAMIYLLSCPQGQYPGCAMVCGQRVASVWTVGATLAPGFNGTANANLSFVETASGREVLTFGVALHDGNDAELTRAIDTLLDRLMSGAFAEVDLRRTDTDAIERQKLEDVRRRVMAESLQSMERRQQTQRTTVEVEAAEKLNKDELAAQYAQREEVKPWEKLGLREGEYVRYKNSKLELKEWKALAPGRFGSLIARAAIGGGGGPFAQTFDGRYVIDDGLNVDRLAQYQFISNGGHTDFDLELGFGVAPWLDITGHLGFRNSDFNFLTHQETVGRAAGDPDAVSNTYATVQYGVRAVVAPFVVRSIRPHMMVGVGWWQGSTFNQVYRETSIYHQDMLVMNQVVVQAGPGVEIRLGDKFDLFVRALGDFSVAGQRVQVIEEGVGTLQVPANTLEFKNSGFGFSLQLGLTFRLRLFGRANQKKSGSKSNERSFEFDDDGV